MDMEYRYSMSSDIHSVSLTLAENDKREPLTFQIALHGCDLVQDHDREPNKKIDPLEVLGMKMAGRVISSQMPELLGRYTLGKRYTYHPPTLTVDGTHVYYHSSGNQSSDGPPRDFDRLLNVLDQCFKALEGCCRGNPTEILQSAPVIPMLKRA
jgi:hypothetical protein